MAMKPNERLWFVRPGAVELRIDAEPPPPPAGHVQVEVAACGLCRFDVALFDGVMPHLLPRPAGHEAVGIIIAVGEGVERFDRGQPVSLVGEALDEPYFARRLNVPARLAAKLPEVPKRPEVWLAEPVACVVNALALSPVRPGSRVAVVGSGFMGLLFVQGLRGQPAAEVMALDTVRSRVRLAERYGAQPVHLGAGLTPGVVAAEFGHFEMVIETAGTQESLDLACELLAPAGELVLFAWHKVGGGTRQIHASAWHQRGVRISNHAPIANPHFHDLHAPTIALLHRGLYELAPLLTHVRPFGQAQQLFETASAGAESYIKGALLWQNEESSADPLAARAAVALPQHVPVRNG